MSTRPPRIRVLVVDDSAFARKVIREVLAADEGIDVVGIARDGLEGLEKIHELTPDVVCLDLVMPGLSGVGVLEALQGKPGPRVVVVTTTPEDGDLAVTALQAGAVDIVQKPTAQATDRLYEMSTELVEAIKVAASAHPERTRAAPALLEGTPTAAPTPASSVKLVVLGTSTGGPQALMRVLPELPADLPVPVCVVLHMPVGYTASLSQRLNDACRLEVVEAAEGIAIRPGRIIVARAGMHLKVRAGESGLVARLDVAPLDAPHRPSVDVLFSSAAAALGPSVMGIVLTGMGSDGLQGARSINAAGGFVVTEAEETCVVYGMPRSVAEAGQSSRVVPLGRVASVIEQTAAAKER